MRRNGWAAVAALACVTGAACRADGPPVGSLGDPAALAFDGRPPTSPDRMRWVLAGDPELQAAAEPDQPLDDYLATLDRRLRVGLHSVGYPRPSVRVDATARPGRIVVGFDLGRRCPRGGVRVDGDVAGLDVPGLVRRLTTPAARGPFDCGFDAGTWTVRQSPAAADPEAAWTAGNGWADFDETTDPYRLAAVTAALAEMGYLAPRVTVAVEDNGAVGVLHVRVDRLGPAATVGNVVVTGAVTNPPAAVAGLLGLRTGDRLDLGRLQAAQQRLWDSGRLMGHTLTVTTDGDGADTGRATVTADVYEGRLPPIARPFTPAEAALLRVRAWVAAGLADGRELDLRVGRPGDGASFAFAAGRRSGFAARLGWAGKRPDGRPVDLAAGLWGTPDTVGVGLPNQRRQWAVRSGGYHIVLSLAAGANLSTGATGRYERTLSFDARAIDGDPADGVPPVRLDVSLAPCYFVREADGGDVTCTVADGRLTVATADPAAAAPLKLVARADTGEVVSFTYGTGPAATDVRLADGAVARRRADADVAGAANAYDPALPLASLASLAVEQAARVGLFVGGADGDRLDRAAAVVAKLASPPNLAAVRWPDAANGDDFAVPAPATGGAGTAVGTGVLAADARAFARGSWAWHLQRAAGLKLAGRDAAADAEANAVAATGGPVACLAAAELLSCAGLPRPAAAFATLGLGRLTDGSGAGETADRVVDAVRRLTSAEVDDLATGLPPAAAGRVRVAVSALRSDTPGRSAAADLLGRAWDLGLRDRIAAELRRLAAPS